MSFGWSAGDVAAAVKLLVNVANALNDIDGAKSHYQKDALYLHELANVLERLKDIKTDDGEKSHIGALRDAIIQFQQRLRDDFEKRLGKRPSSDWWDNLAQIPRKIQYGLFVHKEVDELRRQIDVPLKSVIIRLGIQSLEISREIQQLGQSQKSILKDLASSLADLHLEVGNSCKTPEHVQTAKLFTQITNWLKPLAFDDVYERFLSTLVPGSCEWMLQLDQFQDWTAAPKIDEHYPLLWIAGAAGSGKTRLATKVIQTLRSKKRTAFFYCDAQDANKRSANSILSNWCWQLLSQDQSRLPEVNDIKSKHQILSQGAMKETLKVLLQGSTDAALVIDAFDECEAGEQNDIYRILSGISELARVLVFSRPLEDSFMKLKKAASKYLTLFEMSEGDTSADINQCIENEVAKLDIDDDAIAAKIVSTLQSSAKGMFLWVALMLDELRKPRIDELEYLTILKHLPKDLNNLYSRILENLSHSPPAIPLTKKILEWVLFARRPLSLQEVGAAVMASSSEHRLKQAPISNVRVRKTIVQHCGPLVTIHQSNDGDCTVTLVHYSLKEYFLSNKTHDANEVIFQSNSLHAPCDLREGLSGISLLRRYRSAPIWQRYPAGRRKLSTRIQEF